MFDKQLINEKIFRSQYLFITIYIYIITELARSVILSFILQKFHRWKEKGLGFTSKILPGEKYCCPQYKPEINIT